MLLGLVHGHGLAHGVGTADEHAHLELEIKLLTGSEDGDLGLGLGVAEDLSPGSADRRAGDDDAACSPVVRDREVLVVGLQSILWAAEETSYVESVVGAGVKVRVVPDGQGQVVLHL